MNKLILQRAALGDVAKIGELFDARNETFSAVSMLKNDFPEDVLTTNTNSFFKTTILSSDHFSEIAANLNVCPELQVSILCGLICPEGSARCLKEYKSSTNTIKKYFLYTIRTTEESTNFYHDKFKSNFAVDAIESGVATHVVTGIYWGANLILSFEIEKPNNTEAQEVEETLSALLTKLSVSVSKKTTVDFERSPHNQKFLIKIYSDILPTKFEAPQTMQDALNIVNQLPGLVSKTNNGKGIPLIYRLLPLPFLKYYLKLNFKQDIGVKKIEETYFFKIIQHFANRTDKKHEMDDLYNNVLENQECVPPKEFSLITKKLKSFENKQFSSELSSILLDIRNEAAEISRLETILKNDAGSNFSLQKLGISLKVWRNISEKIEFAKEFKHSGATYIGYGVRLDEKIAEIGDAKVVVLYFQRRATRDSEDLWMRNKTLFIQESERGLLNYFVVDCDIHTSLFPVKGISIHVLQSGKVITYDLLSYVTQSEAIATATTSFPSQPSIEMPEKLANLFIPCTGKSCSPNVNYFWLCEKCETIIKYGFDHFFYCSCGCTPIDRLEFKCRDINHGPRFEKHKISHLNALLSTLEPPRELNILILGETGVGKSTWINGFINFLTYSNLKEAQEDDLITLIPSEFTVCDDTLNEIVVSTGSDSNEVHKTGAAATQNSKIYSFFLGKKKIRLIDTPGIGDPRGIEQDKQNFQNILSTLSLLKELHGICILLKPNNARLNIMFRFCIKELLTYLHRDASRNIMFCFTNSRGTFYKPGDTLPALKSLLTENKDVEIPININTVYCYDSEAYRFLAAIKNRNHPVSFHKDETENFAKSWEKSFDETKRMLAYIETLTPHPIQSTLNLNHARELVVKLTRPLAEISKHIQRSKEVLKEQVQEIERTEATIISLTMQQTYNKPELEITKLSHPKTVCTNTQCKKIYGPPDNMQIDYVTICHNPCCLQGVTRDTIGDPGLMRCKAMNENGFCKIGKCNHSYREHMHIYYDSKEVTKQVIDESVKALLKENISLQEKKQRIIDIRNKELTEYDHEQKQIEIASVKIACFLKHNAITPYNDAMIEYLDHFINEEKCKVNVGGDNKTLTTLKLQRDSYAQEIDILEKEIKRGESINVLKPSDVHDLVDGLYGLKHNGNTLKIALKVVFETSQKAALIEEVTRDDVSFLKRCGMKAKGLFKSFKNWIL